MVRRQKRADFMKQQVLDLKQRGKPDSSPLLRTNPETVAPVADSPLTASPSRSMLKSLKNTSMLDQMKAMRKSRSPRRSIGARPVMGASPVMTPNPEAGATPAMPTSPPATSISAAAIESSPIATE